MGLAIVAAVMDSHGGTVHADNVNGGGALFTLRLPTSSVDRTAAPLPSRSAVLAPSVTGERSDTVQL